MIRHRDPSCHRIGPDRHLDRLIGTAVLGRVGQEVEDGLDHHVTIDLELAWTADDSYTIQYDTRVADYVSLIKNNVSAAARTEIQQFELAIASGPVCLSYGYSQGKVYLDVRNNDAGAVQITTPDSLVIESVSALHK